MRRYFLFLNSFLLFFTISFAKTDLCIAATSMTEPYNEVYYRTKMLCGSSETNRLLQLGKVWLSSFSEAGIVNLGLDWFVKHEFNQLHISKYLDNLMSDPQFFKSLNECFGNDSHGKFIFFSSLLLTDVSAKFTSLVFDLTLAKFIWHGVKTIFSKNLIGAPQKLSRLRAFIKFFVEFKSEYSLVINFGTLGMLLSTTFSERQADKIIMSQIILNQMEESDPTISEGMEHIKKLEEALLRADSEDKRQVILFLLKTQKDSVGKMQASYRNSKINIR